MHPNSATIQIEEPTTPPFHPTDPSPLAPAFLGGGSPHFPPSPGSFHPDYPTTLLPISPTSSFPSGMGGGGMGDLNRRLSASSGAVSPRAAAPGYSLDEFKGFREIADYMSHDGDCVLVRRFGILRFRDLLCKQAQVAELERHLSRVDNGELFGQGDVEAVKGLMRELDAKLKVYDEALERCHRVYTMPRPSARSLNETSSWLRTRGFGLNQQPEEDIVTLDRALITDGPITRFAALIARVVYKKEVTRRAGVDQLSTDRSILVSRALISLIAPVILLVPVVLLCYVRKLWAQIVVVVLATVISSFAMMVAKAGNAEVFMATSAYAAVMVVFLGTVADVSGNGKG